LKINNEHLFIEIYKANKLRNGGNEMRVNEYRNEYEMKQHKQHNLVNRPSNMNPCD